MKIAILVLAALMVVPAIAQKSNLSCPDEKDSSCIYQLASSPFLSKKPTSNDTSSYTVFDWKPQTESSLAVYSENGAGLIASCKLKAGVAYACRLTQGETLDDLMNAIMNMDR